MSLAFRNLAVFDDAGFPVLEHDEADGFFGGAFADYFGCYVEVVGEGIADEGWVCNAD
jgi:hypothetical protein